MPRVIVVGGGIAGLVAARELALGGQDVTLLEARAELGGRVARHRVAGLDLDAGAESFATRGGTVAAFAAELGLGAAVVRPNPAGAWLQPADRAALPLPKTGLLGIPGTPLARDVIAVTGLRGALRAELDVLLPSRVAADASSLGALVRRRMGRRVLDCLVTPVVAGIHSRHPDELAVDRVAPGLRQAVQRTGSLSHAVLALRAAAPAGSAVAGLDGGIYRFVEALTAELARLGAVVSTGSPVADVSAAAVTTAAGRRYEAEAVVLATRWDRPGTDGSAAHPASRGADAGEIVLATLVVDQPMLDAAPRGTGMLVAPGAPGIRAKALTHATAKWSWLAARAGAHRHVLRLSYNDAPEAGLADTARNDAQRLLGVPIPPQSVLGYGRIAWPNRPATSSQTGGQADRPDEHGVWRVGEGVAGVGLAAGIAYAKRVSANVLAALAV